MAPKQTTTLLKQLRDLMINNKYVPEPISAYIIPSNDAHASEYAAECDEFRAYISGFNGSAGTAIVTKDHACLWTDGRYFLQASQQIDSNWTLMKEGTASTPTQDAWLTKTLPTGSSIGADPKLLSLDTWNTLTTKLEKTGHKLLPVPNNLIAPIWADRPNRPANPIIPLESKFSGKKISEKLEKIIEQMNERKINALVVSTLDDIAWTLNLRGSDIAFNPLFFSYLVIQANQFALFVNTNQVTDNVKKHLKEEAGQFSFIIKPYDDIANYIKDIAHNPGVKIWFAPQTINYYLASLVPEKNRHTEISPTTLLKAVKNHVEVEGMKNAHIKDAAALCCYFAWLEKNVPNGGITEVSGADKLEEFRSKQEDFVGLSFPTINGSGPNGAIIHYRPSKETDREITTTELYLCDSGAQFKDGTTDVTRTMHFGTPSDFEKDCFTRVLKGQLRLGNAIFPSKIKGSSLDVFARQYLWDVGLDYMHGTSHGIGAYLNVHEGPMGISIVRHFPDDPGLEPHMFLSNEPGFYENGKFGIRLEDIVHIVPANPPHNFNDKGFLTFETITLVPKQTKMIKMELLTDQEISILNEYHQKCRDIIGPVLDKQGQKEAKEWLWRESEPITRK